MCWTLCTFDPSGPPSTGVPELHGIKFSRTVTPLSAAVTLRRAAGFIFTPLSSARWEQLRVLSHGYDNNETSDAPTQLVTQEGSCVRLENAMQVNGRSENHSCKARGAGMH